ncbi:copper target homolog 1 protein [Haematococcus lacustris]|uniref:magnesium-protoporphyrin IX monomethyl ester (oxidative) cyclase n=1 Tax=Haematococcus lacustris TaxID=44745 RepID=A0A699YKP6_HAELA|nr:copper target homolog 1 protein [Haematococcus lacustris]
MKPAAKLAGSRRVAAVARPARVNSVRVQATAAGEFKMMRSGVKEASEESLLTPRFYTTDFEEMEPEKISGPARKIFIEFLERSCTAEFSGFLLYKELGRRLKSINPVVAEIFTLMSRDEARHAGFLNKAMSDFNLALDLGFLTKNRKYTFFKPKFIFYATYLSEKIGYWRYIRHGDFFTAILKAQPQFVNDWQSKLWSRFFCLSVYITMYLNDHQRDAFYSSLGLNTTQFNQHVIIETNNSTARIFPEVPDVEHPDFFKRMDELVALNNKVIALGSSGLPAPLVALARAPLIERMVAGVAQLFFMTPLRTGSVDLEPELKAQVVY